MTHEKKTSLAAQMLDRYGEAMRGLELYRALGYKTYSGFYKARKNKQLPITIFDNPGRRGCYALTTDVAAFLASGKEETPISSEPRSGQEAS